MSHPVLVAALCLFSLHSTTNSTRPRRVSPADNYRLGLEQEQLRQFAAAATYYSRAATLGHLAATYNLARLYECGLGVPQDEPRAARLYRTAANLGDAQAQTNLGAMYATGRGLPQDASAAALWYERAAAQGNPQALTNLAALYLEGRGVPTDHARAFSLCSRAAFAGFDVAQHNLALMYANGQGVPRDYRHAWAWLDIASTSLPPAANLRDRIATHLDASGLTAARDLAAQLRKQLPQ